MIKAPPVQSITAVAEEFTTPLAPADDPPTTRIPESVKVPVVAVTLRHMVVPARMSAVIARTVDMTNDPAAAAPAGVFAVVVRVASAFAVPVPVPAPVDRKTVLVVFEAAPIPVHKVVPTKSISYHWPLTKEPAETMGLLAPPMRTSVSRVTLKPLA